MLTATSGSVFGNNAEVAFLQRVLRGDVSEEEFAMKAEQAKNKCERNNKKQSSALVLILFGLVMLQNVDSKGTPDQRQWSITNQSIGARKDYH